MSQDLKKSEISVRQKPGKHGGILDPINAAKHFRLGRYLPSPDLAAFIEHYWIIHWDLRGQPPYISEVLPYPSVNIAFTAEQGWITGVTTGKYDYELVGTGVIFGVMFRPGGFHPFWPHRMDELTDKTKPATEVFQEAGDVFRKTLLGSTHDDSDRVHMIEELLSKHHPTPNPKITFINKIIEAVIKDKSLRSTQALSGQFKLSERRLQQLFQEYVGVGLKWVIMRYRLQEAAASIATGAHNWTTIAAELNYSDQAHFARDFKKIIGKTPSEYSKSLQR